MRRALPRPQITDRITMWRSAAGVMVAVALLSVFEGILQPTQSRMLASWLSGSIPAVGAIIAWKFGPLMRPRRSYAVGRVFLLFASFSVAISVHAWHDSPIAGAESFHYILIVLFASVFFSRRDVFEQLATIGVIHAVTLLLNGWDGRQLLAWTMTMLGVGSVGIVMTTLVGRMQALSYCDGLTGADNRRAWDLALADAIDELPHTGRSISLLLIDIDHFKSVNDTGGHEAGDAVLRSAVSTWRPIVRASDTLARLGGDEFALLLRCDRSEAELVAASLLSSFRSATGETCSIGIGSTSGALTTPAALYTLADETLYLAKNNGRATVWAAAVGERPTASRIAVPTVEGGGFGADTAGSTRRPVRA